MVKVVPETNDKRVQIICKRVNDVFQDANLWRETSNHSANFHMGNINGVILASLYHEKEIEVKVRTYRSRFPSRANGYTTPSTPNVMWLNTRHLDRSEASIGSTIVHETVHCVDNTCPQYTFGHGDNYYSNTKDDCAPIWLADRSYKYLSGGIASTANMDIKSRFITLHSDSIIERILA